jgi:arylsulfatase
MRQGNWKLVAKGVTGAWELYDMSTDRTEMHDLASSEPGRVKEMAAKWEAWAKRDHVLPWMWKPQYGQPAEAESEVADRLVFNLKPGAALKKAKAPLVKHRGITIDAQVSKWGAEGVIVAQGGAAEGYSLFVHERRPVFAVRRDGVLTLAQGKEALPKNPVRLGAALAMDGTMTLSVDGKPVATGKAEGTLTKMPLDGLQVGQDANGAVGDYQTPYPFEGEVGGVKVELTTK